MLQGSILTDNNVLIAIIYLACVNVLAFALFGIDKHRARKGAWRIPEKTLMLLAIAGGSVGALIGMLVFRHKTRKPIFSIGVPIVLAVQIALGVVTTNNAVQIPDTEDFEIATVEYVVDGDTVDVLVEGQEERVRLIGIDAPESASHEEGVNTEEGEKATEYLRSCLKAGKIVYLQTDQEDRDRFDRPLRYMWTDLPENPRDIDEIAKKMVNARMVANGYADTMRIEPNTYYADQLETLKTRAIKQGVGVSYLFTQE